MSISKIVIDHVHIIAQEEHVMEEQINVWELAWSVPGSKPPNEAELVEVIHRHGQNWFFYKDEEGNYWYQSERQIDYELAAEERERARKKEALNKKRR